MNDIKLKFCPFCGGEASIVEYTGLYDKRYYVKCFSCKSKTGRQYKSPAEAASAWNNRFGNYIPEERE